MEEEGLLRRLAIADARARFRPSGPWQANPWLRFVLGTDPGPMWGMPSLGGRDAALAARLPAQVRVAPVREQASLHSGAAAVAARRLREGEWLSDLSSARRRAIEKWTSLLSGRLENFSLGRSLVESTSSGCDGD
eukprot:6460467-Amphidinium_carterae.1